MKGKCNGGLAQLARALAWHARGHRFDSVILHKIPHLRDFLFISISFTLLLESGKIIGSPDSYRNRLSSTSPAFVFLMKSIVGFVFN
jgi:hypothetical protein